MSARGRRLVAAVLDAVTYAVAAAAIATAVTAVVSFPLGHGLVGVKFGLFYLTFLVFAAATAVSWPGSAWKSPNLSFSLLTLDFLGSKDEEEPTVPWVDTDPSGESGTTDETPFQALVQRLPPARFLPARPAHRFPTGLRLFLAAFAIAATSIILERVFGAVA